MIGNCDFCDKILKCNRAGLPHQIFGCPSNLVEEYKKELEERRKKNNENR